jgi:hypothetical protein
VTSPFAIFIILSWTATALVNTTTTTLANATSEWTVTSRTVRSCAFFRDSSLIWYLQGCYFLLFQPAWQMLRPRRCRTWREVITLSQLEPSRLFDWSSWTWFVRHLRETAVNIFYSFTLSFFPRLCMQFWMIPRQRWPTQVRESLVLFRLNHIPNDWWSLLLQFSSATTLANTTTAAVANVTGEKINQVCFIK